MRKAGDKYDARRICGGARRKKLRNDQFGEQERANVIRGDLVLDLLSGESKLASFRSSVIDQDLSKAICQRRGSRVQVP